jgi:hypothetical protein
MLLEEKPFLLEEINLTLFKKGIKISETFVNFLIKFFRYVAPYDFYVCIYVFFFFDGDDSFKLTNL